MLSAKGEMARTRGTCPDLTRRFTVGTLLCPLWEIVDMCILSGNKTMQSRIMSEAADALLSLVEKDPLVPHYGEQSFRRKIATSNRRSRALEAPLGGKEFVYLLQEEWADVIRDAGLTVRQLEVLALRLEGNTFEQIGTIGGHTKQGAQNIFFQAAKKLVRAWMDYPYRGLHQVYREEVRRGTRSRTSRPR